MGVRNAQTEAAVIRKRVNDIGRSDTSPIVAGGDGYAGLDVGRGDARYTVGVECW